MAVAEGHTGDVAAIAFSKFVWIKFEKKKEFIYVYLTLEIQMRF